MRNRTTLVVLMVAFLLAECHWIVSSLRAPATPTWPVPQDGFRNEKIDYSAPRFPDAKVATVPEIDFESLPESPLLVNVPDVQANHGMVFEGQLRHPNSNLTSTIVRLEFQNKIPGERSKSLTLAANGKNGLLKFRAEIRAEIPTGNYAVLVSVNVPDEGDPAKRRRKRVVVARGELKVL